MTNSECRIVLPWPPSETSPNGSQGNYYGKARASKRYKATCAWECKAQGVMPMGVRAVAVEITFHPPRRGRIDWDNLARRCKAGLDAVAEAIGVDDGEWWPVKLDRGQVVKGGSVVLVITPAGEADRRAGESSRATSTPDSSPPQAPREESADHG